MQYHFIYIYMKKKWRICIIIYIILYYLKRPLFILLFFTKTYIYLLYENNFY